RTARTWLESAPRWKRRAPGGRSSAGPQRLGRGAQALHHGGQLGDLPAGCVRALDQRHEGLTDAGAGFLARARALLDRADPLGDRLGVAGDVAARGALLLG